ncbi:MAG: DnaJ domain-containing protein [Phycisphaerales bacterium]|nr:DnaJ domain-containing protein [Phycisphaerales bacterium]
MKSRSKDQVASGGTGSIDLRRAHRYAANNISVPLGKVLDLSATGMRLSCPRKEAPQVGAVERFVLSNGTQRLAIKGQIVRARKPLWPTAPCDVGVRFLDASASVRAALEQLGKYGFIQGGKHGTGFKSAPVRESAGAPSASEQPPPPPPTQLSASVEVGDLYAMLGVSQDASDEEIRAAFRVKARLSHPDASDDPNAEQLFADLAKAYKVLIDPEMRARYDQLRVVQAGQGAPADELAA